MKFVFAFLIIVACLIPFFIAAGFGLDALLKYCFRDSGCRSHEICSANVCTSVCKNWQCPAEMKCVGKLHTPTCLRPENRDNSLHIARAIHERLPECNEHHHCRNSMKCVRGLCVPGCPDKLCPANKMCLLRKQAAVCTCLPELIRMDGKCGAKSSIGSSLFAKILLGILSVSTTNDTQWTVIDKLHPTITDYDLNSTAAGSMVNHMNKLLESVSGIDGMNHQILLKADPTLTIHQALRKFKLKVSDTVQAGLNLYLKDDISLTINSELLGMMTCVTSDNMTLSGNFSTGTIPKYDLEFVMLPSNPKKIDANTLYIAYVYNKNPGKKLVSITDESLSKIDRKEIFLPTNVKMKMQIIVPKQIDSTTVNIGQTVFKNKSKIILSTNGGKSVEYESNLYKILQQITVTMNPSTMQKCDNATTIGTVVQKDLTTRDFAMFVISEERVFFRAFYAPVSD